MTTTEKLYTTQSHRYPQSTPCADPAGCRNRKHWTTSEDEYTSLAEARADAKDDDAPAVRIIKVTRVTSAEEIEMVSNPW
jgi:hypothetical protein